MDYQNKRPQDDLPYERRMYYIIKDYRRITGNIDKLEEYAHRLEAELKEEKEKRAKAVLTNNKISEKYIKNNRAKKRLYAYIKYLIEKYSIPEEAPSLNSDDD